MIPIQYTHQVLKGCAIALLIGTFTACAPTRFSVDHPLPYGTAHPTIPGHALAWSDEFNGSTLDTSVWRYDTDSQGNSVGWGNNELQWYTNSARNARVQDGLLTIEAHHEQMGNKNYTSARLHTHGGRAFQYGVIEARIRMPTGAGNQPDAGIFPAFWMLGDNFNGWGHGQYGGDTTWPESGEIDVVEVLAREGLDKVFGTAHWHEPDRAQCRYNSFSSQHCSGPTQHDYESTTFYSTMHTYSVRWHPEVIEWYVDGNRYATLDIRGSQYDEFRAAFFLLINFAVGGLGNTPTAANYPQQMMVDWIRYYCPVDSNGACTDAPAAVRPPLACPTGTVQWVYGDCSAQVGTSIAALNRQQATDGTVTVSTVTSGALGTDHALTVIRSGGSYGGAGWKKSAGADDLSAFTHLHFSYRLATGAAPTFDVKVETSATACNNHTLTGLTADGNWHETSIPIRDLYGAANKPPCTSQPSTSSVNVPFYLFLLGDGSVDIDEIYYQ